jgi:hypothetical protein
MGSLCADEFYPKPSPHNNGLSKGVELQNEVGITGLHHFNLIIQE